MEKLMCLGNCKKCPDKAIRGCSIGRQQYRNTYKYKHTDRTGKWLNVEGRGIILRMEDYKDA